jgi:serine/threonine protein phosphatase 1
MSHVNFDFKSDRLLSVGDLVDRGPNSEEALLLLEKNWFYAVMGNHDAMLLAWARGKLGHRLSPEERMYSSSFINNGGQKWAGVYARKPDILEGFVKAIEKLPIVMTVGKGGTRFNVAHAELQVILEGNVIGLTDKRLDTVKNSRYWNTEHYIVGFDEYGDWVDHALWGRELRYTFIYDEEVTLPRMSETLSTTYVGHTIVPPRMTDDGGDLFMTNSHVFLDTGAYEMKADRGLSIFAPKMNKGWMLTGHGDVIDLTAGSYVNELDSAPHDKLT